MLYRVRLFHLRRGIGKQPERTSVATTWVIARDKKDAAVRAYIKLVGRKRSDLYTLLNLSKEEIEGETDRRVLRKALTWASPSCWRLINDFDIWRFMVKEVKIPVKKMRKQQAWFQFVQLLRNPSPN